MGIKSAAFAAMACVALGAGGARAADITYNVDLGVGAAQVTGSIETDGKTGQLDGSDILSYSFHLSDGTNIGDITSANGTLFTNVFSALYASPAALVFDYSDANQQFINFYNDFGTLCFYTKFACGNAAGGANEVYFNNPPTGPQTIYVEQLSRIGVIGTAAPEPATWAMTLLGVFGIGAALRRRQTSRQVLA